MVDVEVPPSFQLRAGEANSIPGWGNGGGWQVQAVDEVQKTNRLRYLSHLNGTQANWVLEGVRNFV
jgi:hypothetical protein